MPACSLVLPGPIVGAPGPDNLKIRPEFFPKKYDEVGKHTFGYFRIKALALTRQFQIKIYMS